MADVPKDLPLAAADWEKLAPLVTRRSVAKREVVCTEDEPAQDFFVVVSGCVEIFKVIAPHPGPGALAAEIRLALLEPGSSFGERCLFEDTRRNASARAYLDSDLLVIEGARLAATLDQDEALSSRFYRALCSKLSSVLAEVEADLRHLHRRHTFY